MPMSQLHVLLHLRPWLMVVLHFQALLCLLGCLQTRAARPSCTEQSCGCPRDGLSPHLSHPHFAGAGTRTSAFGEQGTDPSPSLLICLGLSPCQHQGAVLLQAAYPCAGPNLFSASSSSLVALQLPLQAVHRLPLLLQMSLR